MLKLKKTAIPVWQHGSIFETEQGLKCFISLNKVGTSKFAKLF